MTPSAQPLSPLQAYLEDLHAELAACDEGAVADYIPELARVAPDSFGIAVATVDGHVYQVGDTRNPFTIQSISKAFVYGLALEDNGFDVMALKVDVEPSGEAFNSISLRPGTGRPLNPMINAGAIAAAAMVHGETGSRKFERILEAFARYAGHPLALDEAVLASERESGHRNRAIAHLLRGFGILETAPEEALDVYFRQCSIAVTGRDLAVMGATLANNGVNPITAVRALRADCVPKVLSVMGTCGMYDYSGNWVYRVGMPAKSGVGGGVVAVLPGQLAVAVFSPRLDEHGNSVRGLRACERISADFGLHLYHSVRATTASVIRHAYDGAQVGSKRLRRAGERRLLESRGSAVRVFALQGDLVFGSTESVLSEVLAAMDEATFFVLDLEHVLDVDRAACRLLRQLADLLAGAGKHLRFTHTRDKYAFVRQLIRAPEDRALFEFSDTDHALEWCEDRLLARDAPEGAASQGAAVAIPDQDLCRAMDADEREALAAAAEDVKLSAGEWVFRRGERADAFFLVAHGTVEIGLGAGAVGGRRLAALSPGMCFGEMGLLGQAARTADARAATGVGLYRVRYDRIPERLRLTLMTAFAVQLAGRLERVTREAERFG